MMNLQGKIALVTGATRGIGQAIALQLASAGAFVIGTGTSEANAEKVTASFKEHQLKGIGVALDVANTAEIETQLEALIEKYGNPDILVNNAGITRDNLMLRMKDEEWDAVININLSAVYKLTKICLKGMLKARWGRIINITSVVAATGNPGQANYAAAKAGLIGFTKSLAAEIASRGITVNSVAPGFIETDMTRRLTEAQQEHLLKKIPVGRMGQPEEISSAVLYLASPQAAYITGETLHVNGGLAMI